MNNEQWVCSKKASQHLGCTVEWLIANLHRWQIPHVKLGRQYRFRINELDAWVNQRADTDKRLANV